MERQNFIQNGVCHLMLEAELCAVPSGAAGERIGGFMKKILALACKRAEETLPTLVARYEQNENPRKHLLHRPILLSLVFSLDETAETCRLATHLCLSRCGRIVAQMQKAAHFDRQSGRFLYEEKEKRLSRPKKCKKRGKK